MEVIGISWKEANGDVGSLKWVLHLPDILVRLTSGNFILVSPVKQCVLAFSMCNHIGANTGPGSHPKGCYLAVYYRLKQLQ
jgi:hypothetical protein